MNTTSIGHEWGKTDAAVVLCKNVSSDRTVTTGKKNAANTLFGYGIDLFQTECIKTQEPGLP